MLYKIVITSTSEEKSLFGSKFKKKDVNPEPGFLSPEEARDWWLKHYPGFVDIEADLGRDVFYARNFTKKGWTAYYGKVVAYQEEEVMLPSE